MSGRLSIRIGAALFVALLACGYLLGGAPAVLGLALVAVAVVAGYTYSPSWRAARRPVRGPGWGVRLRPRAWSGVRIRHQGDGHVLHHERAHGEGVEDLMEAEPPR